MTTQQVMPTAGLEPARLSAPDPKSGAYGETDATERTALAGARTALTSVSTTDRTTDSTHTPRAGTRRGSSYGHAPAGYLTENQLAARWGRSTNTLVGWRTRLAKGRPPIEVELINGVWCYRFAVIDYVEARDEYRWIRPVELRGMALPPLRGSLDGAVKERLAENARHLSEVVASDQLSARVAAAAKARGVEQPELPLSLAPGTVEVIPPPRRFASLRIEAGYALAIATDGTAFYAPVLGGLDFLTWQLVRSLPEDDELLARFARRAAA
jgi:hypothetical protein